MLFFFTSKPGTYNPIILGIPQHMWLGIGFALLSSMWIFQYTTFSKNGIYKPGSFIKIYYSHLTYIRLTDNLFGCSTHSGEIYETRIFKPSNKTKNVIKRKVNQYILSNNGNIIYQSE